MAITGRRVTFFLLITLFAAVPAAFSQSGGKAEPLEIRFPAGSSSTQLTGTLLNGQEQEYVFTAREGQTVTIANPNTSLFDVRVFNEEVEFETEFDSSRVLTFTVPADGDYMLFVRKKMVKSPRRARFSLKLAIK